MTDASAPTGFLAEDEVSAALARQLTDAGSAWLLDVRQILVICRSGARSRTVTDALNEANYPAANVAGGMGAWQAEGSPVERDDGTPGAIV